MKYLIKNSGRSADFDFGSQPSVFIYIRVSGASRIKPPRNISLEQRWLLAVAAASEAFFFFFAVIRTTNSRVVPGCAVLSTAISSHHDGGGDSIANFICSCLQIIVVLYAVLHMIRYKQAQALKSGSGDEESTLRDVEKKESHAIHTRVYIYTYVLPIALRPRVNACTGSRFVVKSILGDNPAPRSQRRTALHAVAVVVVIVIVFPLVMVV